MAFSKSFTSFRKILYPEWLVSVSAIQAILTKFSEVTTAVKLDNVTGNVWPSSAGKTISKSPSALAEGVKVTCVSSQLVTSELREVSIFQVPGSIL